MRLAQENNIDLTHLTGTGKGGRITRKDVLKAIEEGTGRAAAPAQPSHTAAAEKASEPKAAADKPAAKPGSGSGIVLENGDTEIPVSSVRRTIANRMVQSKHEAPHAWTMMEVDVTGLVELRNRIKHDFQKREGVKLTFMPFFIKAVVDALKEYPILNSVWADDKIILKKRINISMATATDDALYVPVIHDADENVVPEDVEHRTDADTDHCKDGFALFGIRQLNAVFAIHQHDQFKRINRIESETFSEERCFGVDISGSHVLKIERLNNLSFQLFN